MHVKDLDLDAVAVSRYAPDECGVDICRTRLSDGRFDAVEYRTRFPELFANSVRDRSNDEQEGKYVGKKELVSPPRTTKAERKAPD